jgi:hypothetical protein
MDSTLKFKVEEMSTLKSKPRRGSGGPRSAHGKSKSSQNSRKHLIFIDRVLPEEENAASLLYDEIQTEFRLQGATELRIGRDLVQNELQAGRIEKFAVQESKKARTLALFDLDDSRYSLRYPIPKERESDPGYSPRMRPWACVMLLTLLRRTIEKHGLRPDEALDCLKVIYGTQMTDLAEGIVIHFQIFKTRERLHNGEENTGDRKTADHQARILEAIEMEIQAQKIRQTFDEVRESFRPTSDSVVLPPPDVDDRIERYRTANMRKMDRLLAVLETVRRLKKKA